MRGIDFISSSDGEDYGNNQININIMKTFIFIPMILCFSMFTCEKNKEDDDLTFQRTDYSGDELRIDGYYYNQYSIKGNEYVTVYFFFRNGIILYGSSMPLADLYETEAMYKSGEYYVTIKNTKDCWGVFNVDGNKIAFERWTDLYQLAPLVTTIYSGDILNDSTFRIMESSVMENGKQVEIEERDETYYFKKFNPKPDSTNSFIE